MSQDYLTAPNKTITSTSGITFTYRELGNDKDIPLVFFNFMAGTLDTWDSRLINRLATKRHLIIFDNTGVGNSSGKVPTSIRQMALDALTFIRALNLKQIDVLGFSMGGMVVQELLELDSTIVRKIILAGTGPRGGVGVSIAEKINNPKFLKSLSHINNIRSYLFFTKIPNEKMMTKTYLKQIKTRKFNRDKNATPAVYLRQLKAINAWAKAKPNDLSIITKPTLIVDGANDIMVPTINSYELNRRIPNSTLIIYSDAGHGSLFQHFKRFSTSVIQFLEE
ncbi:alpha/beta fold hydrolase [Companilactobacillus halodurans]|uniref:Alpha/beta hydrolase n=1 Tax=Companilactobacillus halodurans TaxID=2584183 RepID=A0A5P0ZWL8_9LACO|nr:alpha/beta hydrolase [Companilactobacillus halodurans]MQS76203.1 alpha/beta hydrolase [Companilactobacillus halodurans]MQS97431.1 alpha/beta hydrolase [Companilactobacillus halodurans]